MLVARSLGQQSVGEAVELGGILARLEDRHLACRFCRLIAEEQDVAIDPLALHLDRHLVAGQQLAVELDGCLAPAGCGLGDCQREGVLVVPTIEEAQHAAVNKRLRVEAAALQQFGRALHAICVVGRAVDHAVEQLEGLGPELFGLRTGEPLGAVHQYRREAGVDAAAVASGGDGFAVVGDHQQLGFIALTGLDEDVARDLVALQPGRVGLPDLAQRG